MLWARAAASRTFWTAGKSRPIRMAIMALTTSSSTSVNPRHHALVKILGLRTPPKKRAKAIRNGRIYPSRRENGRQPTALARDGPTLAQSAAVDCPRVESKVAPERLTPESDNASLFHGGI